MNLKYLFLLLLSLLPLTTISNQSPFTPKDIHMNHKKELIKQLANINAISLNSTPHHDGSLLPIYFDMRLLISYPHLLQQFAQHLNHLVSQCTFNVICGVPQAAIPLTTAVAMAGHYPMILQRKEVKNYGTKKYIEGAYKKGDTCVLIEDVILSGFSILESIKILEDQGLVIKDIFVLIDREQGGMENVRRHGYNIQALFTMSEVLEQLQQEGIVTPHQYSTIHKFCAESRVTL